MTPFQVAIATAAYKAYYQHRQDRGLELLTPKRFDSLEYLTQQEWLAAAESAVQTATEQQEYQQWIDTMDEREQLRYGVAKFKREAGQ